MGGVQALVASSAQRPIQPAFTGMPLEKLPLTKPTVPRGEVDYVNAASFADYLQSVNRDSANCSSSAPDEASSYARVCDKVGVKPQNADVGVAGSNKLISLSKRNPWRLIGRSYQREPEVAASAWRQQFLRSMADQIDCPRSISIDRLPAAPLAHLLKTIAEDPLYISPSEGGRLDGNLIFCPDMQMATGAAILAFGIFTDVGNIEGFGTTAFGSRQQPVGPLVHLNRKICGLAATDRAVKRNRARALPTAPSKMASKPRSVLMPSSGIIRPVSR